MASAAKDLAIRVTVLFVLLAGILDTAAADTIFPDWEGDVELYFTSLYNPDGTFDTYRYDGSVVNLALNANLPLTVPIGVRQSKVGQPGLWWSEPSNWDGPILQLANVYNIAKPFVDGALGYISIQSVADAVDGLRNGGPTEKSISESFVTLSSEYLPGGSLSVKAGLDLKFDVYLVDGVDILMDQQVVLERLTVYAGAHVTGNSTFVTRTDLLNYGKFDNLMGTVQGNFTNTGRLSEGGGAWIMGPLNVQGQLNNSGEIRICSGSLNLAQYAANDGLIVAEGGTLQYSAGFANFGTLDLKVGALAGNGDLTNFGTLRKSGPVDSSVTIPMALNSIGNVEVLSGTLRLAGGGSIAGTFTTGSGGQVVVANNSTMRVQGGVTITNAGTIRLEDAQESLYGVWGWRYPTDLVVSGGEVRLVGGGVVSLNDSPMNRILGAAPTDRLVNFDNTICGSGQVGANQMALTNQGVIEANQTNALVVDPSDSGAINAGTMRATNGATLLLQHGMFTNNGGLVQAKAGSTVSMGEITLTGGVVRAEGTGQVLLSNAVLAGAAITIRDAGVLYAAWGTSTISGGSVDNGDAGQIVVGGGCRLALESVGALSNAPGARIAVGNNGVLTVTGGTTITNAGTIRLEDAQESLYGVWGWRYPTDLVVSGGEVRLVGGGVVSLNDSPMNRILGAGPTDRLVNVDNTIRGAGVIDIDLYNTGTIVARGGTLALRREVAQLVGNTLTGGTWKVEANSALDIWTGQGITVNKAKVVLDGPNSLFAKFDSVSTNEGDLTILNGRNFTTVSDFTNSGVFEVGASSTFTVTGEFTQTDGYTTVDGQLRATAGWAEILGGTLELNSDAGAGGAVLSIDVANATVYFDFDQHLDTLAIEDGGKVVFRGAHVVVLNDLRIGDLDFGPTIMTPEPATMGLLALGGLALLRRRRTAPPSSATSPRSAPTADTPCGRRTPRPRTWAFR